MKKYLFSLGILSLLCVAFFILYTLENPLGTLQGLILKEGPVQYIAYVSLLVSVGVFLPLSAMPLIPLAATVMHPLVAALLGVIGWVLGASLAFLIARKYGRKVVSRFVSFDKADALLENVPRKHRFMYTLIFRLVFPTDLANYALGLTKSLGFVEYFIATLLVFTWYSFVLAYIGEAVILGNVAYAFKLGLILLVIFAIGWYVLRRLKNS